MSRKSTTNRAKNRRARPRRERPLPIDTERVVWDAEYRAEIMAELRRRRLAAKSADADSETRDQSAA